MCSALSGPSLRKGTVGGDGHIGMWPEASVPALAGTGEEDPTCKSRRDHRVEWGGQQRCQAEVLTGSPAIIPI